MQPEDFVALFRKYLKSQGLNVTQARERVAAEVFQTPGHLDIAALWLKLRGGENPIGQATLYRTLELLAQAGLVRRLLFPDRACYEASLGRPHHEHLVCSRCGQVIEFSDGPLEQRLAELVEAYEFQHQSHQLMIWGLCPACQKENKPAGLG